MKNYAEEAEHLAHAMLEQRRMLVSFLLSASEATTEDMQRLAAIDATIALAASIKSDELTRAKEGEYERHRKAGTLERDDFRDVTLP